MLFPVLVTVFVFYSLELNSTLAPFIFFADNRVWNIGDWRIDGNNPF